AVGIVGGVAGLGSSDDVRILGHIVLGQTIGSGLGRGGLQVVEVAVELLVIAQTLAHVVEDILGKGLGLGVGQILTQPLGVEAHLVHADKANGGEVVVEGAQIPLGIGIEPRLQQLGDNGTLGLEAAGGH